MAFKSKYKGFEIEGLLDKISKDGGVTIIESIDQLDPNAKVGSLASVAEPGSITETLISELPQPDSSIINMDTGFIDATSCPQVSGLSIIVPEGPVSVSTELTESEMLYFCSESVDLGNMTTGIVLGIFPQIVNNEIIALAGMYMNVTTMEQKEWAFFIIQDGVVTADQAAIDECNVYIKDLYYIGAMPYVMQGLSLTTEQLIIYDNVIKVVAGIPSKACVYLKKDNWDKLKIEYADIVNPPKIPAKISDLSDDKHLLFLTPKAEINNVASLLISSDEIIKATASASSVSISFNRKRDYSFARLIISITNGTTITAENFIWLNEPDVWEGTYIIDFFYSIYNEPIYAKVEKCIYPYFEAIAHFNTGSNTLFNSTGNILKVWIDGESQEIKTEYDREYQKNCPIRFLYGSSTLVSSQFEYSRLNTIYIPDYITKIDRYCFRNSHVDNIHLGRGIKSIARDCFSQQSAYSRHVYITDLSAFMKINFENNRSNPIYLYNSNGNPYLYLNNSKLTDIVIPKDITYIKDYVFTGEIVFNSITIHKGVTEIGSDTFGYLTGNLIYEGTPSEWNKIIHHGSNYKGLTFLDWNGEEGTVSINDADNIPDRAFQNAHSIRKVILGDSVKSVGSSAFSNCPYIQEVIFGSGITQIGNSAFYNNTSIRFLDFSTSTIIPSITGWSDFYKIPSSCKIIVPDALYNEWIVAENWSEYANYIIKKSDCDAQ